MKNPYNIKMRSLALFTLMTFVGTAALQAQTIRYVKPGGTGTGTSWANASGAIQSMINASVANDEVWVAAGTYLPTAIAGISTLNRDKAFILKNNVKVYGGFATMGNPVWGDRNPQANETILSGDLGIAGDNTDNSYHVVVGAGTESIPLSVGTVLDGFTVTKGNANDNSIATFNGYSVNRNDGGGIFLLMANVTMANNKITQNTATSSGGGIYTDHSSTSCTYSVITQNTGGYGGGIANEASSDMALSYVTISGNLALYDGGGISNNYSSISAANSSITGNRAYHNGSTTLGGGIYNYYYATATLTNVTISGNRCDDYGGAIYNLMSQLIIRNSVVYGNSSGVYNTNSDGTEMNAEYSYIQGIAGGTSGNVNGNANPFFINAPSYTTSPFTGGNYNIQSSCSVLINGGNNSIAAGALTDIAGNSRIYEDAIVDIGAYEYQGDPFDAPPAATAQTFDWGATVANLVADGQNLKWYLAATGGEPLAANTLLQQGTYYVTQTISVCESTRVPVNVTITIYNIRYVKQGGTGNGTSWANASGDLQAMINTPMAEQVWVAAGTYIPTVMAGNGTTDRDKAFVLKDNIKVYGGFPAAGSPVWDDRNTETNETILSGDLGITGNTADNAYHVVIVAGTEESQITAETVLDGFTVRDGYSIGASSNYITVNGSVIFQGNGAGINSADYVFAQFSNLHITGNKAKYGGGIHSSYNSAPIVSNTIISNNTGADAGGGIYSASDIMVNNTAITGNSAGLGGGIYGWDLSNGTITLTNCTVSENSCVDKGGGINSGSRIILKQVVVSGNTCGNIGGGIYSDASELICTDVAISGNSSQHNGGAVAFQGGRLDFTNITVSGNEVVSAPSGTPFATIEIFGFAYSVVFKNCVIYGNHGGVVNFSSTPSSYTNCLVQGLNDTANGNISGTIDPIFVNAPSYQTAPFTGGDYNFQSSSPLINAGSNSQYTASGGSLTGTDAVGNPRVYNFTGGGIIDIGAFEYNGDTGCLYTTIWNGTAWSNGAPESYDSAALINGDFTPADNLTACSLTVASGNVTVPAGIIFSIKGNINVNNAMASLNVENNGAIIQIDDVENSGNIVFHRLSSPLKNQQLTLWSSPVSGQSLIGFSPQTWNGLFYEYISALPAGMEGDGYYSGVNTANNFATAKGYLIGMPLTITGENAADYAAGNYAFSYDGTFTGVPHNGTIAKALNTNGDLFTAIGNPYPSPVSVLDILEAGTSVLDPSAGLYLWSQSNNAFGYAIVTATSFISDSNSETPAFQGDPSEWAVAPGQGFLVRSNGISNTFEFTNAMRRPANTSQPFFRSANSDAISRLWLNLTSDASGFRQLSVAYAAQGTTGIDYGMEAKMFGLSSPDKLYSIIDDIALAIQTRPSFNVSDVVPLGFVASHAGEYTITLSQFDGVFLEDQDIFIKDNAQGGITHDLKASPFTFTSEEGTFNNRFEIVYEESLGTGEAMQNSLVVYKHNGELHIDAGNRLLKDVTLYDISGRELYHRQNVNAASLTISSLNVDSQVVIAKIKTDRESVVKKIMY